MSGFFTSVKSIVIVIGTSSKTVVLYSYNEARKSLLPIFMYITAADFSALCKSAYKSGFSPSTRQKIFLRHFKPHGIYQNG